MKIGTFLASSKSVLQIERPSQVHQLVVSCPQGKLNDFFASIIRVWNNTGGQIIPPMALAELAVLNGDEYPLQVGFDFANGLELVVLTYEICDEGSLNPTVYVELDLTSFTGGNVELDAMAISATTAVRVRSYNFMNVVSPMLLPKDSICIIKYHDILSLQRNNDLMGEAEILTHSNYILNAGVLSQIHPLVYDTVNNTPLECKSYTLISSYCVMGYDPNGHLVICTGSQDFLLQPQTGGCRVAYCKKELTKIALQVQQALVNQGQKNNVDSGEFQAAVAAVGRAAKELNKTPAETQFLADNCVANLPSVKIGRLTNIRDLNLSSEKQQISGLRKAL